MAYEKANKLSENREKKGLNPLILIVIPLIKDKENVKISSTSFREKNLKNKNTFSIINNIKR